MDKQQQCTLERDLDNWGAWARSGSSGAHVCGSAEGRYVATRDDDGTRVSMQEREPIRVQDAEMMEAAVLRMRIVRFRKLLKMIYVDHATKVELAAFINARPMMVEPARLVALGELQHVLDHTHGLTLRERAMRRGLHSVKGSNMYQGRPLKDAPAP